MGNSKVAEAFFDESGCFRSNRPFVAGAWFTTHGGLWRTVITEQRQKHRYWYELHFSDIRRQGKDLRAETIEGIFKRLVGVKRSWWCRLALITDANVEQFSSYSTLDAYDIIVGETLARFAPHAFAQTATVVLDERSRPWWNAFLPSGLEAHLNQKSKALGGPTFSVVHGDSKKDDLLQLADCVVAAVRQIYAPGGNERKRRIARILEPLIGDRIRVWTP